MFVDTRVSAKDADLLTKIYDAFVNDSNNVHVGDAAVDPPVISKAGMLPATCPIRSMLRS